MGYFHRSIAFIALLSMNCCARAEQLLNFIHIMCVEESRYLSFEAKDIQGSYVLMGANFNKTKTKDRMEAWQKRGYFSPLQLSFECKLPESTYTIIATQPKTSGQGHCSAAPPITLNLLRDGKPILKDITFGGDCYGGPSAYMVEISDGMQGWGSREMTICTSPGIDHCEFLNDASGEISKSTPIDQNKISEFSK